MLKRLHTRRRRNATRRLNTNVIAAGTTATMTGLLAALSSPSARAQTYTPFISTLSQSNDGLTMFNTSSDRLAQSFITNAAYTNVLLYARLNLALQSTSISTSDVVHLYLYNNGSGTVLNGATINGSQPTTQYVDLGTATVNSTTAATYTFSSSSRYNLASGAQAWLVLQDDSNSNAAWSYTTSTAYTGPGTVNTNAATGSSPDAGSSWLINKLTYTDPTTGSTVNYGEQLFEFGTATAALPETDSISLLASGLFGSVLFFVARRKKHSPLPQVVKL